MFSRQLREERSPDGPRAPLSRGERPPKVFAAAEAKALGIDPAAAISPPPPPEGGAGGGGSGKSPMMPKPPSLKAMSESFNKMTASLFGPSKAKKGADGAKPADGKAGGADGAADAKEKAGAAGGKAAMLEHNMQKLAINDFDLLKVVPRPVSSSPSPCHHHRRRRSDRRRRHGYLHCRAARGVGP